MNNPKFRVWNKKTASWVHGPGKEPHLFGEIILLGGFMTNVSIKDLDECVIIQFSGLKDRNGRDIYESDVLEIWESGVLTQKVSVIFSNGCFGLSIGENIKPETLLHEVVNYAHVVGNIYDNPELLK